MLQKIWTQISTNQSILIHNYVINDYKHDIYMDLKDKEKVNTFLKLKTEKVRLIHKSCGEIHRGLNSVFYYLPTWGSKYLIFQEIEWISNIACCFTEIKVKMQSNLWSYKLDTLVDCLMWVSWAAATPHVQPLWMAFFAIHFKGNKSRKILICIILAILGNCQGQYFSISIKLPNNEITQNLELQDLILTQCANGGLFPKVQHSRSKQSAKVH